MIPPDKPEGKATANASVSAGKADLAADQRREIELLTLLLRQEEQRVAEHRDKLDWFARAYGCLASQPRSSWWLLESKRIERQSEMLKAAGLFDAEAYLRRYPDIAASGRDPLDHYMMHGIHEGRIATDPDDEKANG